MNVLKLGIPKGSLEKATIELFEKSGWRIKLARRSLIDAGITGKDWILENESDVVVVADLIYSKVSKRPTRWVVAVPGDSEIEKLEDLEGKKVATELVNYSRKFFSDKNINVNIEFSWGATEAKVVSGLADAIVEVTETESTIRAHGLRIIYEMMSSNTQFIANKRAWEDPWKREKIENIVLLLQGALRADKIVGLKMNIPADRLDDIISLLPSLNAPTIANLYNTDWYSVETVISEHQVRELIPKLIKSGAEGIIEYGLNKVI